jgi:nickel/cobalt transporter (NicO) family protein
MRQFLIVVAALGVVAMATGSSALAQKSPLGLPLPNQPSTSPPPAIDPPSPAGVDTQTVKPMPPTAAPRATPPATGFWNWVFATQSDLNRRMAQSVKNMKSDNPLSAALVLIAIAFAYGVLHAAGPGHGKSIISAYVLTNRETVRRGIALSFLSALFQALSAIVFVAVLALVLRQTKTQMDSTEATVETISWGLVAGLGAYLMWRQIAPLLAKRTAVATHPHEAHHADHHHQHGPDCGCGHSHMAAPQDLQGEWSWKKALPLALSIGIRPCSGAILLLIFALSQGMWWAGVLGTFAMALGTAITVSALAALAVSSRDWAARASGPGSVWAERIQTGAGLIGATLVFVMGVAFFIASLRGPGPL